MTGVSYDDMVATATVGVSRRPAEITSLAGPAAGYAALVDRDDQAASVLDAAVLLVTARRAGVQPRSGITCPAPASAEVAQELPVRAGEVLTRVLAEPALLADLLAASCEAGFRAPAPLLPVLLDAAVRHAAVRAAVAAVLGERGRWLASHRADWRRVAQAATPEVCVDDRAVWEIGSRDERRAYLLALRERDQAAARDLLAAGWSGQTGDDRADLLAVLSHGLSGADEDFLEAALDDRKAAVRAVTRRLLAGLPSSGWLRRAADRAAALIQVQRAGALRRLVVTLPDGVDAAAVRDGIDPGRPPAGIGARAWLLTQLVAAAPLSGWEARLSLEPARIASLPIAGDHGVDVHAGWRLAATSQASPVWAQALLEVGEPAAASRRPPAAWPADHQLAGVLPLDVRVARAAWLLAEPTATPAAVAEVVSCPGPWPEALADAVLDRLRGMAEAHGRSPWPDSLVVAAARALPVTGVKDYAAGLMGLATANLSCPAWWLASLRRAAATVSLRRAFMKEIR